MDKINKEELDKLLDKYAGAFELMAKGVRVCAYCGEELVLTDRCVKRVNFKEYTLTSHYIEKCYNCGMEYFDKIHVAEQVEDTGIFKAFIKWKTDVFKTKQREPTKEEVREWVINYERTVV